MVAVKIRFSEFVTEVYISVFWIVFSVHVELYLNFSGAGGFPIGGASTWPEVFGELLRTFSARAEPKRSARTLC